MFIYNLINFGKLLFSNLAQYWPNTHMPGLVNGVYKPTICQCWSNLGGQSRAAGKTLAADIDPISRQTPALAVSHRVLLKYTVGKFFCMNTEKQNANLTLNSMFDLQATKFTFR